MTIRKLYQFLFLLNIWWYTQSMIKVVIAVIVLTIAGGVVIFFMNMPFNQKKAEAGDTITVHYTGRTEDGAVFDSSRTRGVPFTFTLGEGEVIAGWDEGLQGTSVGDTLQLVIPPDKAYGREGIPGVIPPDATLIFDVEVVGIR